MCYSFCYNIPCIFIIPNVLFKPQVLEVMAYITSVYDKTCQVLLFYIYIHMDITSKTMYSKPWDSCS